MKRLKLNLALLMVVLGTGAAFAGASSYQTPTIYFDCNASAWKSIPAGRTVSCDQNQTVSCKGTGTPSAPVPLPQKGCGTLNP
ncbi:DUF6520 family protein [Pedobacter sp.]|uniref:DUF6520 family protein n=1 Tax=Pedobacter sp. TaxID=1411316 RepID=UPI002BD17962|nr:DUF6520 family protein [Pedobacter sp.]HWW38056.1 DUF6520 family protein [Pedobacter sp.]